jgi:cell division protease FtsH
MLAQYNFGNTHFDAENMSDVTRAELDAQINELVETTYQDVVETLRMYRAPLEMLKAKLVDDEIVDGSYVYELVQEYSRCGIDTA